MIVALDTLLDTSSGWQGGGFATFLLLAIAKLCNFIYIKLKEAYFKLNLDYIFSILLLYMMIIQCTTLIFNEN